MPDFDCIRSELAARGITTGQQMCNFFLKVTSDIDKSSNRPKDCDFAITFTYGHTEGSYHLTPYMTCM